MSDEKTTPAEATGGQILAFEDLARLRPTVTLKDRTGELAVYEFRLLEFDFGIQEHAEHQADSAEFNDLWAKPGSLVCKDTGARVVGDECPEHEGKGCLRRDKLTAADGKRLKVLLDRMFARCLVNGDELQGKLTDEQKREVIGTFQYAPQLAELAVAQQKTDTAEARKTDPSTTGT